MTPLLAVALLLSVGEPAGPVVVTEEATVGLVFALPKGSCGPLLQSYHPQAGDLLIFRLNNPIYQTCYHLSLSGGAMHAAIVVESPDGGLVLVESRPGKGVHLADLATRVGKCNGTVLVRRRTTPLTADQSRALTEFLFAQLGKGFDLVGMAAIPFRFPICLFGKGKCDPKAIDRKSWCCTSLITCACIHAGLMNPESVNPDGVCASDLGTDEFFLDLSWGWHQGVPITTAIPMEKDGWF